MTGTVHTGTLTRTGTSRHPNLMSLVWRYSQRREMIVSVTDIVGRKMPNSRFLADRYGKKGGYYIYIPDFLKG